MGLCEGAPYLAPFPDPLFSRGAFSAAIFEPDFGPEIGLENGLDLASGNGVEFPRDFLECLTAGVLAGHALYWASL